MEEAEINFGAAKIMEPIYRMQKTHCGQFFYEQSTVYLLFFHMWWIENHNLCTQLDQVAYVRFASVYKEFNDVETFIREIEFYFFICGESKTTIYALTAATNRITIIIVARISNFTVIMKVPESFVGKSVGELNLRQRYNVNIIAIQHVNGK